MHGWLDDWRLAVRQLRLAPGFAAVAIGALALAIGANTTFVSLFHALVLRPLPIERADRLVAIVTVDDRQQQMGLPIPMAESLNAESAMFDGAAAWLGGGVGTITADGIPASTGGVDFAGAAYYHALGVQPALGRLLDAADIDSAATAPAPAAVIGYRLWQRQFGGSPTVLGRVVEIDAVPFIVVGVTPERFSGLYIEITADVTLPISAAPRVFRLPSLSAAAAIARLRDGVNPAQAAARLAGPWRSQLDGLLPADMPASRRAALLRSHPRIDPLETGFSFLRAGYTPPLRLLLGMTAGMILIACMNLAGLLLSRAAARERDLATRLALGASTWRLARQSFTEGLLFAAAGALCGLPLAWWGTQALARSFAADYLVPISIAVTPDGRVLGLTLAVTAGVAMLCTAAPIVRAGRRRDSEALGAGRTIARRAAPWGERILVVQLALSLVLLTAAAALTASLEKVRAFDPGFRVHGLHGAALVALPEHERQIAAIPYLRAMLDAARLPGVVAAAVTETRPAGGYIGTAPASRLDAAPSAAVDAYLDAVSPGYFSTLGIPLTSGRDLSWFDDADGPRVAVVSASLAQRLFPGGNAIGQRIRAGQDAAHQDLEIVGVARDARVRDVRRSLPNIFVAITQEPLPTSRPELLLRTSGAPPREADLQRAIEALGGHHVRRLRAIDEQVDRLLLRERLMSTFASFFGMLAAFLVAIGLYGLLAFAVRVRTREIGVRLAVGASPASVRRMILQRGLLLALGGIAVGVPLALCAGQLLQSSLFDVQAADPLLLALAATFILAVTLAAAYAPARLASRVDPAKALRME